jgi:uncharacterized membrane protein (UPF0127 family)
LKRGSIHRVFDGACLLPQVWRAESAFERMRGLLGRPQLLPGQGLLIESCNLVHTVGMSYPIDLVFLDAHGYVVKLFEQVQPWRFAGALGAKSTVELCAGALSARHIAVGDQMTWRFSR